MYRFYWCKGVVKVVKGVGDIYNYSYRRQTNLSLVASLLYLLCFGFPEKSVVSFYGTKQKEQSPQSTLVYLQEFILAVFQLFSFFVHGGSRGTGRSRVYGKCGPNLGKHKQ